MLFNYNNCKNCKINKRDTFTLRQKIPIEICYIISNYYPHCAKCSNMISQEEQFIHRIKALYGDGLSKTEYQLRWFSKRDNKPLTYDFILDDDRVLKKEIDKLFDANHLLKKTCSSFIVCLKIFTTNKMQDEFQIIVLNI